MEINDIYDIYANNQSLIKHLIIYNIIERPPTSLHELREIIERVFNIHANNFNLYELMVSIIQLETRNIDATYDDFINEMEKIALLMNTHK